MYKRKNEPSFIKAKKLQSKRIKKEESKIEVLETDSYDDNINFYAIAESYSNELFPTLNTMSSPLNKSKYSARVILKNKPKQKISEVKRTNIQISLDSLSPSENDNTVEIDSKELKKQLKNNKDYKILKTKKCYIENTDNCNKSKIIISKLKKKEIMKSSYCANTGSKNKENIKEKFSDRNQHNNKVSNKDLNDSPNLSNIYDDYYNSNLNNLPKKIHNNITVYNINNNIVCNDLNYKNYKTYKNSNIKTIEKHEKEYLNKKISNKKNAKKTNDFNSTNSKFFKSKTKFKQDCNRFNNYNTQSMRYSVVKEISKIPPNFSSSIFLDRITKDTERRKNRLKIIENKIFSSKRKIKEFEKVNVFNHLIEDSNARIIKKLEVENYENTSYMSNREELSSSIIDKIKKTPIIKKNYNKVEWNQLYEQRFKNYLLKKQNNAEKYSHLKNLEKELKMLEETKEMAKTVRVSQREAEEIGERLYNHFIQKKLEKEDFMRKKEEEQSKIILDKDLKNKSKRKSNKKFKGRLSERSSTICDNTAKGISFYYNNISIFKDKSMFVSSKKRSITTDLFDKNLEKKLNGRKYIKKNELCNIIFSNIPVSNKNDEYKLNDKSKNQGNSNIKNININNASNSKVINNLSKLFISPDMTETYLSNLFNNFIN
jgi:hypothetical protein